jgi:two-component system chemotaxis response regulator CheY
MITRDSKNILVAKDSLFFRTGLSDILTGAGHRVRLVEDGNGTINAIETGASGIDLLITDFLLPDMNGFTVLKWISDNGFAQRFPVFVVTGERESSHIVSNLFKYGASGVISKDFTPERIIFHINRALFPDKAAGFQQSVRIPVSVPVDFSVEDEKRESGFFLNISKSGAFLHTGVPLSQGAELGLRFGLPDVSRPLDTRGSVVWKTASGERDPLFGGYGIKFTAMSPGDQATLDSYIETESRKLLVAL